MGFEKLLAAATPIGAATQAATSLFNIFQGAKMMKEANKIKPEYKKYETSQFAKDMLGGAQSRLNSRNTVSEARRRSILGSQANAMSGVQKNALDPSQALNYFTAIQAQTDNSIGRQDEMDMMQNNQNVANLMNAQNVMIGQDQMKYQDMMNKFQMDTSQKNALRGAGQQTIASAGSSLAGTFMGVGQKYGQDKQNADYMSMMKKFYGV
jgi:hypothetical protein